MTLENIIDAVFDIKNKENCASGVVQNIFHLLHLQRVKNPYIFDFFLTQLTLASKQCFKIREFEDLYSDLLRKTLSWFYKKPVQLTNILVSQIFFVTFEFQKIIIFRLTPENNEKLIYLLKKSLYKFIEDNFNICNFEDYLRTLNINKVRKDYSDDNKCSLKLVSLALLAFYVTKSVLE